MTGIYVDAANANHGFARTRDGHVATFSAPDAGAAAGQGTRPSTNNIEGEVTGWYADSSNLLHGFIWMP